MCLTCGNRSRFTLLLDSVGTMHRARQGPLGIARAQLLHLLAGLCLLLGSPTASAVEVKTITQYAGTLLTPMQYVAAVELWTKESNIRPNARNGSHYGICQGRSKYMAKANYKQQVRWCISYAYNRYGSMTAALTHWKVHGWH